MDLLPHVCRLALRSIETGIFSARRGSDNGLAHDMSVGPISPLVRHGSCLQSGGRRAGFNHRRLGWRQRGALNLRTKLRRRDAPSRNSEEVLAPEVGHNEAKSPKTIATPMTMDPPSAMPSQKADLALVVLEALPNSKGHLPGNRSLRKYRSREWS